jgi:hypothetical protein
MAQLRAFIEQLQQQRRDDQQRAEQQAQQQQAEIAALRARLGETERVADGEDGVAGERTRTAAPARRERGRGGRGTSRRALLKWGGATAAAATVALVASEGRAAQADPAGRAADGGSLIIGQTNTAESQTALVTDGSLQTLFQADASNSTYYNPVGFGPVAISALANISGANSQTAFGVFAQSTGGTGVSGLSTSGIGVVGESETGVGVQAISHSGIALELGIPPVAGRSRMWQHVSSFVGAPTSGAFNQGEQIRDGYGDLYLCVASGSPGTWKKVAAIPSTATGGASVLFGTPYRIFDTRDLTGVPFNNGAGNNPMTPSQIKTLQITGIADPNDSSIVVPSGAAGIIGNLIAIAPSGEGFLGIQPSTGNPNSRAWVNYEANVTIDNAVLVGLSANGKIDIQCNIANAGAALTITGYII